MLPARLTLTWWAEQLERLRAAIRADMLQIARQITFVDGAPYASIGRLAAAALFAADAYKYCQRRLIYWRDFDWYSARKFLRQRLTQCCKYIYARHYAYYRSAHARWFTMPPAFARCLLKKLPFHFRWLSMRLSVILRIDYFSLLPAYWAYIFIARCIAAALTPSFIKPLSFCILSQNYDVSFTFAAASPAINDETAGFYMHFYDIFLFRTEMRIFILLALNWLILPSGRIPSIWRLSPILGVVLRAGILSLYAIYYAILI